MSQDLASQFNGLKNLSLLLIVILMSLDIYYIYYDFIPYSFTNTFVNRLCGVFIKVGLLKNTFYPKIAILILTIIFVLFDKGKKDIEAEKQIVNIYAVLSILLFVVIGFIPQITNNVYVYIFFFIGSYLFLVRQLTILRRLFGENIMKDRFNMVNKIFPQMTRKVENDLSINIPYKFVSKYKETSQGLEPILENGYVNIVSPNRAVLVLGMPGSGKTYSFNEEIIRQHIEKGFSMINYDFKFPTLTNITYNYYNTYSKSYNRHPNGGRFRVINIDDPRYSHRCNPIRNDLITKKSEAIDAVYTLFYNIDKKSATKQDFFQMSAMAITSGALWFLRMYEGGKYLSLPHLIEFIQQSDEEILKILADYDELTTFVSAFADALKKNAFEQLAGQTASARIPLGKLATDEMYYVMTDPDETGVNLRVNLPEEVTVLNIANNPETQKTNAPALGLFMSQAGKLVNAQNRVPCTFHVDELPTIFINGLDTLIATARSNKVCTILSAQDYTQLVREYGREIADSIFNTIANKVTGQVAIETAEKFTKAIGKINYRQQSVSVGKDDTSSSFSTQREYVVPAEDVSQFSQGEFAGILADTFSDKLEHKAFRGFVSPDKSSLKDEEYPMVNPDLTERDLKQNTKKIQQEIKNIISLELSRISGAAKAEAHLDAESNEPEEYQNDIPYGPDNTKTAEDEDINENNDISEEDDTEDSSSSTNSTSIDSEPLDTVIDYDEYGFNQYVQDKETELKEQQQEQLSGILNEDTSDDDKAKENEPFQELYAKISNSKSTSLSDMFKNDDIAKNHKTIKSKPF